MMSLLTWSALPSQSCRTWKPSCRVLRSYFVTNSSRSSLCPPAFHALARMPARRRCSDGVKPFASETAARISRRVAPLRAVSTSAHAPSKETADIRLLLGGGRRRAELLERRRQLRCDRQRVAILDLAALEHVDHLSVAHQRNRRRRGAVAGEVVAGAIGGLHVGAGEHRRHDVRLDAVAQPERDAGTGLARRPAPHPVYDAPETPRP